MKTMNLGQALDDFILNRPGFAGTRHEWFVALTEYVAKRNITPKHASGAFWTESAVGNYVGHRIGKSLMVSAKEPGGIEIVGRKVDIIKTREKAIDTRAAEVGFLHSEVTRLKKAIEELGFHNKAMVARCQIMTHRYQEAKNLLTAIHFTARVGNDTLRKHHEEDQRALVMGMSEAQKG